MDRGNQYIQLVKVLYCKLPTIGKQLPSDPTVEYDLTQNEKHKWDKIY